MQSDKLKLDHHAGILPMQIYTEPFWKHSGIEIYNESNLDTMIRMPNNCIDLTVTSPPYDQMRIYNGYSFFFKNVADNLFRITKEGGVVIWVVGDATINGSETGSSFKQALYFKEIGFNLYDTMFYEKASRIPTEGRYYNVIEYMFVLSKGKPKTINFICDHVNKTVGTKRKKDAVINKGANVKKNEFFTTPEFSRRANLWCYGTGSNPTGHPAPFPEELAQDHIYSWSNEGDVIYEPFGGSGTVAKMCHLMNRKCVMSEISKEYCEMTIKRLTPYVSQQNLFV